MPASWENRIEEDLANACKPGRQNYRGEGCPVTAATVFGVTAITTFIVF